MANMDACEVSMGRTRNRCS